MLGAIYIGLSGMDAYSKGLQTISNNVANLNSPGYKSTSVTFTDMFNYGGGGLSYATGQQSQQAGAGVRFGQPETDFSQGDLRQSGGDLDLAIQGKGFLVLLDGDKTYYARTGQFAVDNDGFITLQGTTRHLAVLDSSGRAVALNLEAKQTGAPAATTTVKFAQNLSSDLHVDPDIPDSGSAIVSNITVYDSRGAKQVWQAKFTPKGADSPGEWNVLVTDQLGNAVGGTDTVPLTLKFTGGIADPAASKLTIAATGADPFSVMLDFSDVTSNSGGSFSSLSVTSADGNATGALTSVTIDEDGQVKLTYSNSKTELEGAVALADFRDPQQLEHVGGGQFKDTGGGQMRLLASGQEGIGKLVSKEIEASNVDLSQEFGDLILIQRGFQASSQVVSVSNDMIQQLFGIRGQ